MTPIKVGTQPTKEVEQFTYLGSLIAKDGNTELDVNSRIGKAAALFRRMNNIWKASKISTQLKFRLYNSMVLLTALYASETWKNTVKVDNKLNVLHQRYLRRILKTTYRDYVTNEEVLKRANSRPLNEIVTVRRLKLAGHILRRPAERHAKTALTWTPIDGQRKRGRPKATWRTTFQEDLHLEGITWQDMEAASADRSRWRMSAARCPALDRRT